METLKIEIKKNKCFADGKMWGKVWSNKDLLGQYLLNVLFYLNKLGNKKIEIIVDGLNETESFKQQVKDKYSNIGNTQLRDSFFLYSNIK